MQIVLNKWYRLPYSEMSPLTISLNFDRNNLSNNGIMLEILSYKVAIWDDIKSSKIKISIFNESYL